MDSNSKKLNLGRKLGYMGLLYHIKEAYEEINIHTHKDLNDYPEIAKFSKKYYKDIDSLNKDKKYDYCFIGSINSCFVRRIWVIQFVKKYFTKDSIFVNTDNNQSWNLLGDFDKTKDVDIQKKCYNPKIQPNNQSKKVQYREVNENIFYFQTMRQSKFVLCPAGDEPWSFRFYEVLMCKSIPIVESIDHTYRSEKESNIKYNYLLHNEPHNFDNNIIDKNTEIFEEYHLLK